MRSQRIETIGTPVVSRLVLRLVLLLLVPILSAVLLARRGQFAASIVVTLLWIALEVSIACRLKISRCCKRVPFIFRLLASMGVEVQLSWLFAISRPPPLNPDGDTISIVLPCANETDFVKKTIQSVFESTPADLLREIIVVDDASLPPVSSLVSAEELHALRARLIRHDIAEGLIRSKKFGGDAATGDIIVFLDCHVKPIGDWTTSIVDNLRENHKRVVVPSITSLNPDTWQEEFNSVGGKKMCLTWNADFVWCNSYPGPYVPIMSGGLLAMTRTWWDTIGGYDEQMHAWGGENLDQSLRTWLCGGEIRVAEGSRVAHMWRDPKKPKTQLHYAIPSEHVRRNRLRAAQAWLGRYAAKVRTFPEFEDFREGGPLSIGSLQNIELYKDKLACKDFDWYINRFGPYYFGTGQLPDSVFNLRHQQSGLCLHHEMSNGKSFAFTLLPCSRGSDMQRFHEANQKATGQCCSGLKLWDIDACLSASGRGSNLSPDLCQRFPVGSAQKFQLTSSGALEWAEGAGCVMPRKPTSQVTGSQDHVVLAACLASQEEIQKPKVGQRFGMRDVRSDGSFKLLELETSACVGYKRNDAGMYVLTYTGSCEYGERWKHADGQLRNVALNLCVDANDMLTPILYPCYPPGTNFKQNYSLRDNGFLELPQYWADNGRLRFPAKCIDAKPSAPVELTVSDCASFRGQEAQKWEKIWPETPLETKLSRSVAVKPNLRGA